MTVAVDVTVCAAGEPTMIVTCESTATCLSASGTSSTLLTSLLLLVGRYCTVHRRCALVNAS